MLIVVITDAVWTSVAVDTSKGVEHVYFLSVQVVAVTAQK